MIAQSFCTTPPSLRPVKMIHAVNIRIDNIGSLQRLLRFGEVSICHFDVESIAIHRLHVNTRASTGLCLDVEPVSRQ